MRRPTKQDQPTAERILAVATPLFYRRGLAAVTLDEVATAAQLTKRTLYYHFATKDELVLAYLTAWRDRTERTFAEETEGSGATKLLSAFARLEEEVARTGYRGCPFVNAVAEINDRTHPASELAIQYKAARRAWFERLLRKDKVADAAKLSQQIMTLWDGCMVRALVDGSNESVRHAQHAVAALLKRPR